MKPARTLPVVTLMVSLSAVALGLRTGAKEASEPVAACTTEPFDDLSPSALVATADGQQVFIACATAKQVLVFDTVGDLVTDRIPVSASPLGLAISKDGTVLYVACAAASSVVCVVDVPSRRVEKSIPVGHTAMAPVLSRDEQKLYVCNRFNDDVSVIDLRAGCEAQRIRVRREPVAAALTPDGKCLLVANHLHDGPANDVHASGAVSVIDTSTHQVVRTITLTLGSSLLRGICVSPDGRFAAVTHLRSLFWLPTSGVDWGRINGNALSVLDLTKLKVLGTLLLDQTTSGAANPWAVAWTTDGKTIAVSHAGTHEVSLVDAPVDGDPGSFFSLQLSAYGEFRNEVPPPPAHPVRVRKRVPLPGNGPRALALVGSQLYVANYFSDDLCRLDVDAREPAAESLPLVAFHEPGLARKGEMLFNDARLCSQGWQSCASCHDTDARTDALNWDLLNDGVGNPKNTKSLLWAPQTGPAMALGVRTNAAVAVRAGLRHILFSEQPEEVPRAIDAYLESLQPVASPALTKGRRSCAAERGAKLFMSARLGCADCHPPPLFTDLAGHDVGTAVVYKATWEVGGADKATDLFDTPTLVELWRTAPYLHDGSAVALREVLTSKNPHNMHGRTSHLQSQEIDDLVAYLLSL